MNFQQRPISIVDGGIVAAKCKLVGEQFHLTKEDVKLTNDPEPFVLGVVPMKSYGTSGLIAPRSSTYNTLVLMHKTKKQRCKVDADGKWVFKERDVTSMYGKSAGVADARFVTTGAILAAKKYNFNTERAENGWRMAMQECAIDFFAKGRMTYSVEKGRNITALQAMQEVKRVLEDNGCPPVGITKYDYVLAVLHLLEKPNVVVRVWSSPIEFEKITLTGEVFRRRVMTHNTVNKTMERGTEESRAIACISGFYKVCVNAIEEMAKEFLNQYPHQVMTMGGAKKDQRLRNILFNEMLTKCTKITAGAEDKTGWNRQIMAKNLILIFREWCSPMAKDVREIIEECWKVATDTYLTIDPLTLYDDLNRKMKSFQFYEIPFEKLPQRYKDCFENNEDNHRHFVDELRQNHMDDPLVPIINIGDLMVMGVYGAASSCMRIVGEAVFWEMLRDLLPEKYAEDHLAAAMGNSSDDSMVVYGASDNEVCDIMQNIQATIDLLLNMQISGKKTNYTQGLQSQGAFCEMTTQFIIHDDIYVPGSKVMADVKLGGQSNLVESKKLFEASVKASETGNMHMAYAIGWEVVRLLGKINKFRIEEKDPTNPRVDLLRRTKALNTSILTGKIPTIDPVSGNADPFFLDVVRGEADKETAIATVVGVSDPYDEHVGLRYGEEEKDPVEALTAWGALRPGTSKFIEGDKKHVEISKKRKREFDEAYEAVQFLCPAVITTRQYQGTPRKLLKLECLNLLESGFSEDINERLRHVVKMCSDNFTGPPMTEMKETVTYDLDLELDVESDSE